jgi:hypothetical protein
MNWWRVRGGGVTLYYNYTPCAFSLKIIDPLLQTAYWIPPTPIAERYKINPPPIAEQGTPFCRHTQMFRDRTGQLLAYTGSWRGVQPGRGTGVEPGGHWSREFIAFISKIFKKVNTGGLLREGLYHICSRVYPLFKAKDHPLTAKIGTHMG